MIEIKFRAWNVDHNPPIMEFFNWNDLHSIERLLDKEVMQYTGLKDKSGEGEELYHKDLIVNSSRNGGKPHIVEWSEWYAGWVGVYGGLEYLISTELHEIGKVGNVHENPELLL